MRKSVQFNFTDLICGNLCHLRCLLAFYSSDDLKSSDEYESKFLKSTDGPHKTSFC